MPVHIRPFLTLPLALITLLVLSSGPAYAEWVELFHNDDTGATTYFDKDTIRREGDLVKWLELTDFKTVQNVGGIMFLSTKVQWEFACAEEYMRILALTEFSGNMGKGNVVLSESPEQKWRPVEPESLGKVMWKAACGKE